MGTVSKVALVLLRLGQLACGAIVLGILGYFFHLVSDAGIIDPSARLVYAAVVAALTIVAALVFIAPLAYSFWAFPLDLFFFAAWLAAFCVLMTLTRTNTCEAEWYRTYWGFYWGRWYRDASPGVDVMRTGCSAWRTVLAFSFVAMLLYLLSAVLGVYWTLEYGKIKTRSQGFFRRHWARRNVLRKNTRGSARTDDVEHTVADPTATTSNQPALPAHHHHDPSTTATPATTSHQPGLSAHTVPSTTVTPATPVAPGTTTAAGDVRPAV